MLVRPKAWKRWWKRFSLFTLREKGVGDTAPLLWDCPGSAHRAKRDFVRSCSSVTGQKNPSDLLHFDFNTRREWAGSALRALPDGHCWLNANLRNSEEREEWGRKGQWEDSTFQGQIFSFTPCSRGGAAHRVVPAVPTSPGTPDKASLSCLSFILYPWSSILDPFSLILCCCCSHWLWEKSNRDLLSNLLCKALGFKHSRLLHPKPLFPNAVSQLCVCWQKMGY